MRRTVFITGCSSGIGRASALYFGAQGYQVVATSRNLQDITDLAKTSEHIRITTCDVTQNESIRQAVQFAQDRFGKVDVLINNAGYALIGPVESISLDEARKQFEVNTFGVMNVIKHIAPIMRQSKRGRIINVSSIAGRTLVPLAGWYSASKFALEAVNDALRFELGPQGIDVISILPGPVLSHFLDKLNISPLSEDSPQLYRRYMQHYETRRARHRPFAVSPELVAALIFKAASTSRPRARYYITLPARIFNLGKKFIPDKFWDRLTKRVYGFDSIDNEYKNSTEDSR